MISSPSNILLPQLRQELATAFFDRGMLMIKDGPKKMTDLTARIADLQKQIGSISEEWRGQIFKDLKLACAVACCVKGFFDQSKESRLDEHDQYMRSGPILYPQTERGIALSCDLKGTPRYLHTPLGLLFLGKIVGNPEEQIEIGRKVQAYMKLTKISENSDSRVFAVERLDDLPCAPVSYRSDEQILSRSTVEELWTEFSKHLQTT